MNVIVSNKQKDIIDNANIDAIKDLNGIFDVDDLISKFKNYFFSKMILDATSIMNFTSPEVLEKLAKEIGSERLILLLPSGPEPPKEFVDTLIQLKIYNFSTKIEDVVQFITNPRTINDFTKKNDEIENNFYANINSLNNDNVVAQPNYNDFSFKDVVSNKNLNSQDNSINTNISYSDSLNNLNIQNTVEANNTNFNNLAFDKDVSSNENERNDANQYQNNVNLSSMANKRIIGIKNVTDHAGSTTLVYLLTKMVNEKLRMNAMALEVNKEDFKYFHYDRLKSVQDNLLENTIKSINTDILFIDLNNSMNRNMCDDIIYLIEPSVIKLNKLMMENKYIFRELMNKKIILSKSLLSNSDVKTLSREAGVEMFMNIPPINDRVDNDIIKKLLENLNIK